MIAKELESLIKNTLKGYAMDYNKINPDDKVDFNLTFTTHKFSTKDIDGYDKEDPKFDGATKMNGKVLYYLRLSKTLVDKKEKRVIFTAYRPEDALKKDIAKRGMLMECVKQMMVAGIEYSEAIYRMNEQDKQPEEEESGPEEIFQKEI